MAKAGDDLTIATVFTDSAGKGVRYADAAAFTTAGGSLYYINQTVVTPLTVFDVLPTPEGATWAALTAYALGDRIIPTAPGNYFYVCTTAGTSDATEPATWDTDDGTPGTTSDGTVTWTTYRIRGQHRVRFETDAGDSYLSIRMPAGQFADPDQWAGIVQANDADSLAALLLNSVATPGVLSGVDISLGSVTTNDAFRSPMLTIPEGLAEQAYAVTDLTGYLITAAAKFDPEDAASIPLTCAWIDAADRTFRVSWDEMPAAMVAGIGTLASRTVFIDVQVTKSDASEPWTFYKSTITLLWDRSVAAGP